ncbi:winged helix-turn-helix transcriptional regulator [Mesorhizobium sp. CAU 1741]|uniref:winged helix-turn-helix transcriptional regulator n=1 Tax=Mesorhizobium sp. CAU 1741 TaxID=3140366 RepID=UPI00325B96CB
MAETYRLHYFPESGNSYKIAQMLLADDGVIRRIDFQTVPPHVEYELTDFGRTLAELLAPLCEWGTHHNAEVAMIVKKREHVAKVA